MNSDDLTSARWFKSSHSDGQNNCVEVAILDRGQVALRDSKDQGRGPILSFTASEWAAFIDGAVDGEFNVS